MILAATATASAALFVGLLARPVLRGLPEPAVAGGEVKTPYAELATSRFVVTCTVLSAVGALVPTLLLPTAVVPLWWVLAVPTLFLAAIDDQTTWTPLVVQRVASTAMVTAVAAVAIWTRDFELVARAGLGAAAASALFLLLWGLTGGGMGFGDVRAAPLVGAATAGVSWSLWATAFVLASIVAVLTGVVLGCRGRRSGFALVPALVIGAYLSCALRWLIT